MKICKCGAEIEIKPPSSIHPELWGLVNVSSIGHYFSCPSGRLHSPASFGDYYLLLNDNLE